MREHTFRCAEMVIVAWGALPKRPSWVRARAEQVLITLSRRRDLYALRVTGEGFPSHPLYLPGDLRPQLYRRRKEAA